MQAISINSNTKSIENIDVVMQADTIYSFFNSILIDELITLKEHTIYTDANALEENKIPFFIGEQLILGNALILGRDSNGDTNSSINLKILQELISYELTSFYKHSFKILSQTSINLYKTFLVDKDGEKMALNVEWVLQTFNIADEKTKNYFLNELNKSLELNNTQIVLEKMAQLAINAA